MQRALLSPERNMAPNSLFTYRAAPRTLPELMDQPCSLETLRGCLRSLQQINHLTGSYTSTLRFLHRAVDRAAAQGVRFTTGRPLRILDIGSGGGDTLCLISRWAAIRRIPVTLTGVDLNPQSAILARETEARLTSRNSRLRSAPITWLSADALTLTLPEPPDVILSSLFMHHLEDAEILRVLRWQQATATLGWFINDLERSPRAARLFTLLGAILRWHPFCRHDGPVSFRRAFCPADWHALLARAGIASAKLIPTRPARLCVEYLPS